MVVARAARRRRWARPAGQVRPRPVPTRRDLGLGAAAFPALPAPPPSGGVQGPPARTRAMRGDGAVGGDGFGPANLTGKQGGSVSWAHGAHVTPTVTVPGIYGLRA